MSINQSKELLDQNGTQLPVPDIAITLLSESDTETMVDLIRRNLGAFDEVGSVLASSFRRTDRIIETYRQPNSMYLVARYLKTGAIVGGVGLGTLAGLPVSEGIGEVRELVVDETFRGRGYGKALLERVLTVASTFGYHQIYLETTPGMIGARKLFQKFGFKAVVQAPIGKKTKVGEAEFPCYYLYSQPKFGKAL